MMKDSSFNFKEGQFIARDEQLHCPICHNTTSSLLCSVQDYNIKCCSECQTDFVINPPSEKERYDFYNRSDWFESGEVGGYDNYDAQTKFILSNIKEFLRTFTGESLSILDVGCGYGNHLELAASLGWRCFGIEPSDHARAVAIVRLGNRAEIVKSAEELIPHSFDAILMLDVVEHVADPYKFFFPLYALGAIREKTTILLTTPNAGSINAIKSPATWRYRHPPSHLVFYKASGLEQLFKNLRFKEISVRGIHPTETGKLEDLSKYEGLEAVVSGSDFIEFMRERYVPSTWSEIAEYEHFPRYELASGLAVGLNVLDFACGTGYGSAMLATKANSVLGVDIDASALEWARRCHRLPNLSFECNGDFLADFEDQVFDMVTCFEMIEHVGESDQNQTIQALARVLRQNGLLFISTPNPEITNLYGANPYHLRERNREEFLDLLKESFTSVQLVDQYALTGVFFSKSEQSFSIQALHGGPMNDAVPLAYVAICSQGALPSLENRGYLDTQRDYISSRLRQERKVVQAKLNAYQNTQTIRTLSLQLQIAEDLQAEMEQAHNSTVANLSARAAEMEQAHNSTVANLSTRAAEMERQLDLERRSRWSRLGNQLRRTGFHRSTVVRGALDLAALLRRQVRQISSPFKVDMEHIPAAVLKSNDHAYTVRQSLSLAPDKPTVLHAIANFCLGGSSRLVVDLIESLGDDFEQAVVTRYIPRPPAYLNLKIYEYGRPSNSKPFQSLIDQHKPLFVHIHYWGDCDQDWYEHVFHACEAKGIPVIQNINTPVAPHISSSIIHNVYVSDYVRQTYGEHDKKAMIIYPGSDLNHFSVRDTTTQPDNCIGMVYRLENDKLNSSSIDVFIKVAQRRPATKCLIVGDGNLKSVFEQRVAEAGVTDNFVFTGYVPYQDLPCHYKQMSLFVAPVWKESFGQVSSFAMNMGLPVVGYAIGAIPSIVEDEQLLTHAGDSEGLASLIIDLLDNRQRRLAIGLRNHEKAQAQYSVATMIKKYSNLYASMSTQTLK